METPPPLHRLATDAASLPVDTLRALNADHPFSPLPAIALLMHHPDSLSQSETDRLRHHLAMVCGDKTALFNLLGEQSQTFADIYPPAENQSRATTDNAIDTFFANYGMADPAETELLERMIFNPVPDYAELLLRDADDDNAPINVGTHPGASFQTVSAKTEPAEKPAAKLPPAKSPDKPLAPPSDDSLLSESLAKIFIKQGRYERAYEIISNLSLNYPKKSIYFADQLRFLQKLITIKQAASGK